MQRTPTLILLALLGVAAATPARAQGTRPVAFTNARLIPID